MIIFNGWGPSANLQLLNVRLIPRAFFWGGGGEGGRFKIKHPTNLILLMVQQFLLLTSWYIKIDFFLIQVVWITHKSIHLSVKSEAGFSASSTGMTSSPCHGLSLITTHPTSIWLQSWVAQTHQSSGRLPVDRSWNVAWPEKSMFYWKRTRPKWWGKCLEISEGDVHVVEYIYTLCILIENKITICDVFCICRYIFGACTFVIT